MDENTLKFKMNFDVSQGVQSLRVSLVLSVIVTICERKHDVQIYDEFQPCSELEDWSCHHVDDRQPLRLLRLLRPLPLLSLMFERNESGV